MYAWSNEKAQIDLIIDRKDQLINLLEIKFSDKEFLMTSDYEMNLLNKKAEFQMTINTKKSVWMVLMTTYGLKAQKYAGLFEKVLTMKVLFEEIENIE